MPDHLFYLNGKDYQNVELPQIFKIQITSTVTWTEAHDMAMSQASGLLTREEFERYRVEACEDVSDNGCQQDAKMDNKETGFKSLTNNTHDTHRTFMILVFLAGSETTILMNIDQKLFYMPELALSRSSLPIQSHRKKRKKWLSSKLVVCCLKKNFRTFVLKQDRVSPICGCQQDDPKSLIMKKKENGCKSPTTFTPDTHRTLMLGVHLHGVAQTRTPYVDQIILLR